LQFGQPFVSPNPGMITKVAREVGVGNGTVQRIAQELRGPFVAA
jgi:hypothetical protein